MTQDSNRKKTADTIVQEIVNSINLSVAEDMGFARGWNAGADMIPWLMDATMFAARKHRNQRRKDIFRTPYINHPIMVVNILAGIGRVRRKEELIAAMLHDTVEDTNTTFDEIEERYGESVKSLVMELTDDKTLPKEERKRLQIEHAAQLTPAAKLIKIADKIANVTDLIDSPPADWDRQRQLDYLQWASAVVQKCGMTTHPLTTEFVLRVTEARAAGNLH